MAAILPSSADDRLRGYRRKLTLQVFLQAGPFWDAVREFRAQWGIEAVTRLPADQDRIAFPPSCPEPDPPPTDALATVPYDWPRSSYCWQEDVAHLIPRVIPGAFVIPGHPLRSQRLWFPFLSACVRFDPPDTQLLDFADQTLPIPETFLEATSSGPAADRHEGAGTLSMVAPPITLDDTDRTEAWHRWSQDLLIDELHRILEPQGVDLKGLVRKVVSDPVYRARLFTHPLERDPLRANIVVTPETTDGDVRSARKLIFDRFGTPLRVGRPPIDDLTAVQVSVFVRDHGWTEKRVAEHFGWNLSEDVHGALRRSDKVRRHLKRGDAIRAKRKNAGSFCTL